jgi:hypothetical protein
MVVYLKELSNWSPDIKNKKILIKLRLKITVFEVNVKDFECDLTLGKGLSPLYISLQTSLKMSLLIV